MIRILIGGDVCPMGQIEGEFVRGNAEAIFHDLSEEISSADLSVVNLECPLITEATPIAKAGPVLGASTECVKGFTSAKWDVLNVANNHSYDHGAPGLRETLNAVKNAGLGIVGAGATLEDARLPYVKQIGEKRIVVYSMTEHEFSVAGSHDPGANPLDLIDFIGAVREFKQQGVFIVLIHGGKEFYPYPTPGMVRRCRFMIDQGADAVICCHAHCPLPWEIYSDRPIIYGLGNLIFESSRKMPDYWHQGYLARLTIEDARIQFDPIPYEQSRAQSGARKMGTTESKAFLDEMMKKVAQIKDFGFVEGQWAEYCRQARDSYLSMLFGYNKIMRKMRKLLLKTLHSKEGLLRALNLVQCETHREVLDGILRDERGEMGPSARSARK
jgi:poly-gamma-glutamate capsule biosynthesis protein CapA/YwtB (metallophosphatase superfamily)